MTATRVKAALLLLLMLLMPALTDSSAGYAQSLTAVRAFAVWIDATGASKRENGAGVLVGFDQQNAYILTARHVVAEPGAKIQVRFLREAVAVTGQVFERFDEQLDLAAVVVPRDQVPFALMKSRLPAQAQIPAEGAALWAVGHPQDPSWTIWRGHLASDPMDERFELTGNAVDPGFSGGPVFDQTNALIGMMLQGGQKGGTALKWADARRRARDVWRLPLNLIQDRTETSEPIDRPVPPRPSPGPAAAASDRPAPESAMALQKLQLNYVGTSGPGNQYLLEVRNMPSGHRFEYSTEGATFASLTGPHSIPIDGPPTLIVRVVDSEGKEISRLDKSTDVTSSLTRTARAAIPKMQKPNRFGRGWACDLFGCSFMEMGGKAICSPAVTSVELGEAPNKFTQTVDRSACFTAKSSPMVCHDVPHLAFPVALEKIIYARFNFIDGTSLVEELPVDTGAIETGVMGRSAGNLSGLENWTVLEPVANKGAGPIPFAALTYIPTDVVVGGYSLFIGLRGCEDRGTKIVMNGWWIDEDGKGLIRRNQGNTIVAKAPGFGPQGGNELSLDELAKMPSKPIEITIAADTEREGGLGPYTYRVNPKAPVLIAARRAGPPRLACKRELDYPRGIACTPEKLIAWLTVRTLRIGPASGNWTHEFKSFGSLQFRVPEGWTDVFHQMVLEDGSSTEIERVRLAER